MTMVTYRRPPGGAPAPRSAREVWAQTRPNVLRFAVELYADRAHAAGDAEQAAYGLVVTRLPWGRRAVRDPRVASLLDAARARALAAPAAARTGDARVAREATRAIAAVDPARARGIWDRAAALTRAAEGGPRHALSAPYGREPATPRPVARSGASVASGRAEPAVPELERAA